MGDVRSRAGAPTTNDFNSPLGMPIVVDQTTGNAYVLLSDNTISGLNTTGTATNLSGGTVNATTGNFSGLVTQGDQTAPAGLTQLGGMFSTNTTAGSNLVLRKSTNAINPAELSFAKSRGTNAAPSVVAVSDQLSNISVLGYDGTNYITAGQIVSVVEGTISAGIVPSRWAFATANVSGTLTEALRIDSAQNVLVTAPSGLGYGAGAGGTVTQATSKSTSVTLNKPTGQITMNNAALAAGASVVFTLINSLVSANDTVIVTLQWGLSVANYSIRAGAGVGGILISVTNMSAGSLSESPVINFAIIKGAIA